MQVVATRLRDELVRAWTVVGNLRRRHAVLVILSERSHISNLNGLILIGRASTSSIRARGTVLGAKRRACVLSTHWRCLLAGLERDS